MTDQRVSNIIPNIRGRSTPEKESSNTIRRVKTPGLPGNFFEGCVYWETVQHAVKSAVLLSLSCVKAASPQSRGNAAAGTETFGVFAFIAMTIEKLNHVNSRERFETSAMWACLA